MTEAAGKQAETQTKQAAAAAKNAADKMTGDAFEIPTVFRDMAEKTVSRAKQNYDAYKNFAEEATEAMEDAMTTANKNTADIQRQALTSAKEQMNAGFDFAEKMLSAKTVSEAVELQTSFMRQQFEVAQARMKEFQELSTRLQQETTKPFTNNFTKVMENWRVSA